LSSENALDPVMLNTYLHKYRALTLLRPFLKCVIDKERYIYDRDMPHLSFEIDGVKVGDHMQAMIVNVKNALISCTIQNSKILGCK
jgi:hypothetical protein